VWIRGERGNKGGERESREEKEKREKGGSSPLLTARARGLGPGRDRGAAGTEGGTGHPRQTEVASTTPRGREREGVVLDMEEWILKMILVMKIKVVVEFGLLLVTKIGEEEDEIGDVGWWRR